MVSGSAGFGSVSQPNKELLGGLNFKSSKTRLNKALVLLVFCVWVLKATFGRVIGEVALKRAHGGQPK
jgi:hypothetical protein